jgi:hypothetical protein
MKKKSQEEALSSILQVCLRACSVASGVSHCLNMGLEGRTVNQSAQRPDDFIQRGVVLA